jgi:hypothetical protein
MGAISLDAQSGSAPMKLVIAIIKPFKLKRRGCYPKLTHRARKAGQESNARIAAERATDIAPSDC